MFETYWLYGLLPLLFGSTVCLWASAWTSPLWQIPGPMLGRLTSLYRVYLLWSGRCTDQFERMHGKYGPVVRTGPKHVVVSDPDAIFTIYDSYGHFPKVTSCFVN